MNGAHLHLIVTHVPVLGVAFGTLLLAIGLWRNNRPIQQAALSVMVLAGVAAVIAYFTGEGAEEAVERSLGTAETLIDRHETAGLIGLVAAGLGGVLAAIALASGRKGRQLSMGLARMSFVFGLVTSGILTWVANLGGQIGHPEIRSAQVAPKVEAETEDESDER